MADLTEIQSAQAVKITDESTFASVQSNNYLQTIDYSNNSGTQNSLNVGTSAVLANCTGSNLSNRKGLSVYNNSSNIIYWGYSNTVTTSTGTPIQKNELVFWKVGPNTNIYLISTTATNDVRITENA